MKESIKKGEIFEPTKGFKLVVSHKKLVQNRRTEFHAEGNVHNLNWIDRTSGRGIELIRKDLLPDCTFELEPILDSGIWIDGSEFTLPPPTLETLLILDYQGLNQIVARPGNLHNIDCWVVSIDDGIDEDISSHLWDAPSHWQWISAPKSN